MAAMSDIKVLSTHALYEVLVELVPAFERASGHRLSFNYNPTAAIRREIDGGAAFDVAIITRAGVDELTARGVILRESSIDLARCGLGVSVRKDAPKPDIGTVEAFKRALLNAKSVVRSKDGASGKTFEALLERLGITEAMRDKIIVGPAGRIAELVARGEGELAPTGAGTRTGERRGLRRAVSGRAAGLYGFRGRRRYGVAAARGGDSFRRGTGGVCGSGVVQGQGAGADRSSDVNSGGECDEAVRGNPGDRHHPCASRAVRGLSARGAGRRRHQGRASRRSRPEPRRRHRQRA